MGAHGAAALLAAAQARGRAADGRLRVLTHCNTGSLATAAYGTALGVIRALHEQGQLEHAYCCETRPYNQVGCSREGLLLGAAVCARCVLLRAGRGGVSRWQPHGLGQPWGRVHTMLSALCAATPHARSLPLPLLPRQAQHKAAIPLRPTMRTRRARA